LLERLGWTTQAGQFGEERGRETSPETPIRRGRRLPAREFIEDKDVENPAYQTAIQLLQEQLRSVLSHTASAGTEVLKIASVWTRLFAYFEEVGLYFNGRVAFPPE
jgi:RNA polymerase primary sigma factor